MARSKELERLYAAKRKLNYEYDHGWTDDDWNERFQRIKDAIKQEEERLKHEQEQKTK